MEKTIYVTEKEREMQLSDVLYDDIFNNLPKEKQPELIGKKDYFAKKAGITL